MDFRDWHPEPLLEALELEFRNPTLFRTAMTHRSFLNEYTGDEKIEHNERMEFLGDAVIEYVVTEYLYAAHPGVDEGRLTMLRGELVKGVALSKIAEAQGFAPYVLLGQGQPCTEYILCCVLEALIGAIDLDRGLPTARLYVDHLLLRGTRELAKADVRDSKSRLQEELQGKRGITPRYVVVSASGPDHLRTFIVAVFADNDQMGIGSGSSKKAAEFEASRDALLKVFGITLTG